VAELIRQMLAEGKSEAEIKQYFVEYYGARVLSEPPRQGFNWIVYVLPPLMILAGVVLLFRTLRGWVKPAAVDEQEVEQLSADSAGTKAGRRFAQERKMTEHPTSASRPGVPLWAQIMIWSGLLGAVDHDRNRAGAGAAGHYPAR
jgi:hypothetical protein